MSRHAAEELAISVVIPTFNRCELLRQTMESLRRQTLSDCEFCIVDDGSESDTIEFLQSACRLDSRFRLLEKPRDLPRGCQSSKNFAIPQTRGRYLVFLDSDDLISPECLSRRAAWLDAHPEIDMAVGEQAVIDENAGKVTWLNRATVAGSDLDRFLSLTQPLDIPWVNGGVAIRSHRLQAMGVFYRPEFRWEDAVFHLECIAKGLGVGWMPRTGQPDSFYRLHGQSMGSDLWTDEGLQNVCQMLLWMESLLKHCGQCTESRRAIIARNFFHLVLLRAIDHDQFGAANDFLNRGDCLFTKSQRGNLRVFLQARRLVCWSRPLTWWANRFIRRSQSDWFPRGVSTWGCDGLPGKWNFNMVPMRIEYYAAAVQTEMGRQ